MKLSKFLSVLAIGMTPLAAHAGDRAGNGGNVVVCKDKSGQISSIELLDFYEARVIRGFTIDTGPANLSADQKLDLIFSRLAALAPAKAKRLRASVESFSAQASFIPGIHLVATSDSNHILVPDGCDIEQIVNQKEPVFPEDHLFTVSKDLWDLLSPETRAGLILHETFYHEALHTPSVSDSVAVRYFNGYLCSSSFSALTVPQLHKVENYVPFPTFEQNDIEFSRVLLYPSGWIQSGVALEGSVYQVPGQQPWPVSNEPVGFYDEAIPQRIFPSAAVQVQVGSQSWNALPLTYKMAWTIDLSADGHVDSLGGFQIADARVGLYLLNAMTPATPTDSISLVFNKTGALSSFKTAGVWDAVEIAGPEDFDIQAGEADFDDQGQLQWAMLSVAKTLLTDAGDYRLFPQDSTVYFDAQKRAKTSNNN